jgi:thioredoxin-like negative regulator of GroEL
MLTGAQDKSSVSSLVIESEIRDSSIAQLLEKAQASLERGDLSGAAALLEQALSLDKSQKKGRISGGSQDSTYALQGALLRRVGARRRE